MHMQTHIHMHIHMFHMYCASPTLTYAAIRAVLAAVV